jgi:UDP-N-acetylmuramate dehydrogenase
MAGFVTENAPLAPHTYLGVGGRARWLARPRSVNELAELVRRAREADIGVRMLGLGANLLVGDDGVDGVVVRLSASVFREIDWAGGGDGAVLKPGREVLVTAGGGADMNRLALDAVRRGLSGLEGMAGIPGTLGGIVRMNAGGRFGQIADVVREVSVVCPNGRVQTRSHDDVGFRYRGSNLGDCVVYRAKLGLTAGDPAEIRQRFLDAWAYKRKSQPLAESTAGCVFKNPPGHRAGALIDQAGLKGRRVGGAYISPHHANFIVANEGATAGDVFTLIGEIRREVAQRFGLELDLEIEVWGRRGAPSLAPVA